MPPGGGYAGGMSYTAPASWLTDALAPLDDAFGTRLGFARDGSSACWSFDGHRAIVEQTAAGRIEARFMTAPEIDAVSGRPLAAVYTREAGGYPLSAAGCERMVADMMAFFSGIREPRFTFVDAR